MNALTGYDLGTSALVLLATVAGIAVLVFALRAMARMVGHLADVIADAGAHPEEPAVMPAKDFLTPEEQEGVRRILERANVPRGAAPEVRL